MIRISSAQAVHEILTVLSRSGDTVHLDKSRSLLIMTPEVLNRTIKAAQEAARDEDYWPPNEPPAEVKNWPSKQ